MSPLSPLAMLDRNFAAMIDSYLTLEEKILRALRGAGTKTFGQLEVLCGAVDPAHVMDTEAFGIKLDKELQKLIACGKVVLVARRPELCFQLGTALDQIVKGLELDGQEEDQQR